MIDMALIDASKILDVDLYGAVKRNPYEYYLAWNQQPAFFILSEGYPQAVYAKQSETSVVLEDHHRFSSVKRPYPGTEGFYFFNSIPSVTDSDPPVHTRRRRLMMPALTPRKLLKIEAGLRAATDAKLDAIAAGSGIFDLVSELARPIAIDVLLGLVCDLPSQDWPLFTGLNQAQKSAFSALGGNSDARSAYDGAWSAAVDYCEKLIEARRRAPVDDLVSNMLAAQSKDDSALTTKEVLATLILLFSAGLGGITATPAWTLWRLARDPSQMALLQANPALITGAITESIRMEPSSFASLRYATGEFEFAGLQLTNGMPVHTLSAAGNYDPARFPDPLRFDITRPTDWLTLTSFGHGVHHCIGNAVARMAGRVTVEHTIKSFPKLRLVDPDGLPPIDGVLKQRGPRRIMALIE